MIPALILAACIWGSPGCPAPTMQRRNAAAARGAVEGERLAIWQMGNYGRISRHQAAARFGVAPSTAIKWGQRLRQRGSIAAGQMGGHKPKAISGEPRAWPLRRRQ